MDKKIFSLSDIVRCACMTALIAVCSWITVPIIPQIPFTMQTFAVFFALEFAGGKCATVSALVYLALGAVGAPVFSGFRGGVGHLVGPTGGYIVGFLISCAVFWVFEKRAKKNAPLHIAVAALSMISCYALGTVWFMIQTGTPFGASLAKCVVPYIAPDAVKIALAAFLASRLKKIIKV